MTGLFHSNGLPLRPLERGARRLFHPQTTPDATTPRILLVDNYDSFTFNLVQFFVEIGAVVSVVRNDEVTTEDVANSGASHVVISPGPGRPDQAGVCPAVVRAFLDEPKVPLLGVCLGHQMICEAMGAKVEGAPTIVHGKYSAVIHTGDHMFEGIPRSFLAGRYHSLTVDPDTLPASLRPTATTEDGVLMAVAHENSLIFGVQFHPESILSEHGHQLLRNFLAVG